MIVQFSSKWVEALFIASTGGKSTRIDEGFGKVEWG
jgi:hypothetical protein